MELEFKRMDDFLKLEVELQNGDYLYEHDKETYPLKNEFDLENLYFVTMNLDGKLEIHSKEGNKEKPINLRNLNNNWWIMKLPEFIRKKIGLQ